MNWDWEHHLAEGPPDNGFATVVSTGHSTLTCECGYSTGIQPTQTAGEMFSRHIATEHPDEPNPVHAGRHAVSDLVEFLRARLDEDQREASGDAEYSNIDAVARYARRVLAEVDAKRRILTEHRDDGYGNCYGCGMNAYEDMCNGIDDCPTLCALALPYADHPDYQEEWRV